MTDVPALPAPTSKKVLILGGAGMLGHKLLQVCRTRFDVWATFRNDIETYVALGLISRDRALLADAIAFDSMARAIARVKPDVVVNCVGLVKQHAHARDPIISISVNSLFPHLLASVCVRSATRLIHFSTDCVFSGHRGMYRESDTPDPEDLYGRSKLLGEVDAPGVCTLRTSIIGRQLHSATGLLEWLLSQRGKEVHGFTHAIFSGVTTLALATVVGDLIQSDAPFHGLHHVASEPISKYDLLVLLDRAFNTNIRIRRSDVPRVDRSLAATGFRSLTNYQIPTWPEMVEALVRDSTPYERWRAE
jgi:dTDP-4-dehydrorhamnose reductase